MWLLEGNYNHNCAKQVAGVFVLLLNIVLKFKCSLHLCPLHHCEHSTPLYHARTGRPRREQ